MAVSVRVKGEAGGQVLVLHLNVALRHANSPPPTRVVPTLNMTSHLPCIILTLPPTHTPPPYGASHHSFFVVTASPPSTLSNSRTRGESRTTLRAERNAEEFARSSFMASEVKVPQLAMERTRRVQMMSGRRDRGGREGSGR